MSDYYKTIENLTRTGNVVKSIKSRLQHIEKKFAANETTPFMVPEQYSALRNTENHLKTELCAAYNDRENARIAVDELFASMRG